MRRLQRREENEVTSTFIIAPEIITSPVSRRRHDKIVSQPGVFILLLIYLKQREQKAHTPSNLVTWTRSLLLLSYNWLTSYFFTSQAAVSEREEENECLPGKRRCQRENETSSSLTYSPLFKYSFLSIFYHGVFAFGNERSLCSLMKYTKHCLGRRNTYLLEFETGMGRTSFFVTRQCVRCEVKMTS